MFFFSERIQFHTAKIKKNKITHFNSILYVMGEVWGSYNTSEFWKNFLLPIGFVPTLSLVLSGRTFAFSFFYPYFSPSIFKKKVKSSSLWLWSSEKFFLSRLFWTLKLCLCRAGVLLPFLHSKHSSFMLRCPKKNDLGWESEASFAFLSLLHSKHRMVL